MRVLKSAPLLIILGSSILLINCSQQMQNSQSYDVVTGIMAPGTFSDVYQTLHGACVECHNPTGAAYLQNGVTLDFTSADTTYQTLTSNTVTGQSSTGICAGVKIISPGSVETSYLAAVLIKSYSKTDFAGVSGCQPYTAHLQDTNLSSAEQSSLISWIQSGALNN